MGREVPGELCWALEFGCQAQPGHWAWCCGSGVSAQTLSPGTALPCCSPSSHPKPKTAPRGPCNGHYIQKSGLFLTHLYYIAISISNFCCCSHHRSCCCFYLPTRPRWSSVHCRPVHTFNRELLKSVSKISHHEGRADTAALTQCCTCGSSLGAGLVCMEWAKDCQW